MQMLTLVFGVEITLLHLIQRACSFSSGANIKRLPYGIVDNSERLLDIEFSVSSKSYYEF